MALLSALFSSARSSSCLSEAEVRTTQDRQHFCHGPRKSIVSQKGFRPRPSMPCGSPSHFREPVLMHNILVTLGATCHLRRGIRAGRRPEPLPREK